MRYYRILVALSSASIFLCLLSTFLTKQQIASTEKEQSTLLMGHLKLLLRNESNVEPFNEHNFLLNAIILQQTLMNSLETGNWDATYLQPIPIRNRTISVVFSSWRTGSTFLGDIINSVAGTYYHYEPFNYRSVEQQETTVENVNHVLKLIKCQYDTESVVQHIEIDAHWHYNKRLYRYCDGTLGYSLCKKAKFREKFCNIFPRHLMKLVRARISLADAMLNDTDVHVKVVLQVRDPRAVYLSRKSFEGCNYHPHCHSIEQYCNFLVEDHGDIQHLLAQYPNRIRTLRYEDLAEHPFTETKSLFTFLNLPYTQTVTEFLKSHTTTDKGDLYSTFRDSKSTSTHWIKDLNVTEVEYVQGFCRQAMKLWGYKIMENDRNELIPTA